MIALRPFALLVLIFTFLIPAESLSQSLYDIPAAQSACTIDSLAHHSLTAESRISGPDCCGLIADAEFGRQPGGFLFGNDGSFLTRLVLPDFDGCVVMLQEDGEDPVVARLADPVHDPESIGNDIRLRLVTGDRIVGSLDTAGVMPGDQHCGVIAGFMFLASNSYYYGPLDFARNGLHDIHPNELYLTHSRKEGFVAHNIYNFGNFLWGAAAHGVGVPLLIARIGAHIHNLYHRHGRLDSSDDQFSIGCGYHWDTPAME